MDVRKSTIGQIIVYRIRFLVDTILKPTFLTWVAVFVALQVNKQPLDLAFYGFTAALIGVKRYFDWKETANN